MDASEVNNFVWAIKNGELHSVQDFIENKSFNVNSEYHGRYPVHYAADFGQSEVLKFLLSRSAQINVEDKHGITALLAAIWEGHTECVRILLEGGANCTGKTPDGKTYLEVAEKADIVRLLQNYI